MRNSILFVLLLIVYLQSAKAQFIYPNETCAGARPLTVSTKGELSEEVIQRNRYADFEISPIPTCGGINNARQDLWYSFTAPTSTVAVIPEGYSGFYQVFSGSCGALTSIACNSGETTFEPVTGLIPGQQYFLRTYTLNNSGSSYSLTLLGVPVNDVCANAATIPVEPFHSQTLKVNRFTNELATATDDNSCGNLASSWVGYEDVWYKFVAANAAHSLFIQAPTNGTRVAVYTGAPGSLTQTGATFNSSSFITEGVISFNNLTPGQTYYIRAGASSVVKFNISITTGAPENDVCINADTVLMSSSFNCENTFTFRRIGATNSTSPCPASSPNDVWFIFMATVPDITATALGEFSSGLKIGLLSGDCSTLTCLVNSNTSTLSYSGLTVGNYYYLKVGGTSALDKPNYICITPRIANDECTGAISLPIKPYDKVKTTLWNIDGATSSMPTCNGQANEDVWFKFIATDTACVITADGETAFPNFQVLNGTCGALTSVHCSSVGGLPTNTYQRTEKVSGLVPGNEYFVRYMTSNASGFFTLDINSLPPNDDCSGAKTLIPKSGLAFEPVSNNGILDASPSMEPCNAANYKNDIWYKFTATSTSSAIVSNRIMGNTALTVSGFQVFEGNCTALTPVICFEQGTVLHKAQTLTGLTQGETYYIRQYGNFSTNTVSVVNSPVNDNMSGAIQLSPAATGIQVTQSYYLHGATKQFGKICTASPNEIYHDVWFYFIANAASHTVTANTSNFFWNEPMTGYSYRLEAFRGYAPDSTTLASKLINCAANTLAVNGLTAGDTVYVRVSNTAAENNTSIFSMSVTSTQSLNEPSGALTLTKSDSYQYSLTTAGATQSLPAMGCTVVDFPDDDIWLKFTAATDIRRVIAGFETRDVTIQLFSGTPGNLTHLMCSDNIMVLPQNLVNGQLYYLRLYSKLSAASAQFQIGLFGEGNLDLSDCIGSSCIGPNLLINPGVENISAYLVADNDNVATFPGRKLAEGWYNGNRATPDIWDAAYPAGQWANVPGQPGPGRPEIPRSGTGMLGLLNGISIDWHEYASGKLTQPLVAGKNYVVSFYVRVAEISHSNSMPLVGAYFSNDSIVGGGRSAFEIMPHIRNTPGEPVENLNGWRKICGIFTADKAYNFIILGSFGEATLFNSVERNYIYIDDVVVAEISDCTVLPLKLLNFRGRMNDQNHSKLEWETSDEINTSRFEIEWRTEETSFTRIGTVQASGNRSSTNRYDFLHLYPADGNNYYRLKMIDIDEKFTYSSIVRINKSTKGNVLSAYPNPVTSMLYLNAQAERNEMVVFSIIQTDGRVVATRQVMIKKGSNAFSWEMGNLATGAYFIRSTNHKLGAIKIMKQ